MKSFFSKTVTWKPAFARRAAVATPPAPAPDGVLCQFRRTTYTWGTDKHTDNYCSLLVGLFLHCMISAGQLQISCGTTWCTYAKRHKKPTEILESQTLMTSCTEDAVPGARNQDSPPKSPSFDVDKINLIRVIIPFLFTRIR